MADKVFKKKVLTREEVDSAYKTAIKQVEAQLLENHIMAVMNPDMAQFVDKENSLRASYARLEDDYNNWLESEKVDSE